MATVFVSSPLRTRFARLSPVFLVDEIEPCLEFWVDRLGFEVRLQRRDDDRRSFVLLSRDDVELAFRTRSSLEPETPGLVDDDEHRPRVVLYLRVDDLDEVLERLQDSEIVIPPREAAFGSREVYVREPSGRIVALISDR